MDIREFHLLIPQFSTPVFEWSQRIKSILATSSVDLLDEHVSSKLNTVIISKLPLNILQLLPGNILPSVQNTLNFLLHFDRPLANPADVFTPGILPIQLKPSHLYQHSKFRVIASFPPGTPSTTIDSLAWAAIQNSLGNSIQLVLPTLSIKYSPTDEQLEILDEIFLKSVARTVPSQVTVNNIQPSQSQATTSIFPYSPPFEGAGCQFSGKSVVPNPQYVAGLSDHYNNPNYNPNPNSRFLSGGSCTPNGTNNNEDEVSRNVNSRLAKIEGCLCKISQSLNINEAQYQSRAGDNFDENDPNPNFRVSNPNPRVSNPSYSSRIQTQSWRPSGVRNSPRPYSSAQFQSWPAGLRESIRPQAQTQTDYCYYHSNFGVRARSCIQPCSFNNKLNL